MNDGIKEGIIYTRVSSHGQVTKGEGLESQRYSCEKLAKERGIKILEVFEDKGVSGSSLYRPGLDRLTKFLKKRKMKPTWVLIDEIDRFARLGVQKYHYLKDEVTRLGGKFMSVKDDLESETAASRLIENVKVSLAGFDREHNQERVNTIFHEIMHADVQVSGLNQEKCALEKDEHEESVVNVLSNMMMAIFRDNPWLIKMIEKDI